ncbi:MAG TPA: LysR family transcriptional regulator [Galbitalea sp.]|jgi:DNA-binding transcriptional LysR family regulator
MELRQLEHFVAVAEERHFTRAAQNLLISQSGLSASIRALEVELGATLFVRSTRRVELTTAGKALLADSIRTLASAAAAQNAVAAVRGLLRGTLSVGAEQCVGPVDIPTELAGFRQVNPGVDIRLRFGGTTELTESVASGLTDVALVVDSGMVTPGVRLVPLATHGLVILSLPGSGLSTEPTDIADLADRQLVGFQPGWGCRTLAEQAFALAGVDYRPSMEVNDVHSLLDLVGHGLGVAVVPAPFGRKRPDLLRATPLTTGSPQWTAALAVAEEPSPAATAFLDQIVSRVQAQAALSTATSSAVKTMSGA